MSRSLPPALSLAVTAARAAADKLGQDVIVLDVGDVIAITDAFVLASGANTRQVRAIVEAVELTLREEADVAARSVEGLSDATWVLLDFGEVIVHVFVVETRAYYDLERLWADVPTVAWQPLEAPVEA